MAGQIGRICPIQLLSCPSDFGNVSEQVRDARESRTERSAIEVFTGLLAQQQLGSSGASFLESIPTSIQTLLGMLAILGAGWTWFVRPRMIRIVVEAVTQSEKSLRSELTERIEASEKRLRSEIAANREQIVANREQIVANREQIAANRKQIAANGQEIAANRKQIAANRDLIVSLADRISAVRIETRDQFAETRRENHEAHAAIGDRIDTVNDRMDTVNDRIGNMDDRIDGMSSRIDGVNDRIDRFQMHVSSEISILRKDIADVKTDTVKLAGAIDLLSKIRMKGRTRD